MFELTQPHTHMMPLSVQVILQEILQVTGFENPLPVPVQDSANPLPVAHPTTLIRAAGRPGAHPCTSPLLI